MPNSARQPDAKQRKILSRLQVAHKRVIEDRARLQQGMEARAEIVTEAREAGCTWTMIAGPMAVTKQGARKGQKKRERL